MHHVWLLCIFKLIYIYPHSSFKFEFVINFGEKKWRKMSSSWLFVNWNTKCFVIPLYLCDIQTRAASYPHHHCRTTEIDKYLTSNNNMKVSMFGYFVQLYFPKTPKFIDEL